MTGRGDVVDTAMTVEDFSRNIDAVRTRIDNAALRAGRDPAEIRLLPVSKTVPEDRLRLAIAAGCHELGENKVQEARRKHAALIDEDVRWAIIGHLQTNKAKDVAAFASEFHALDSLRVAEALDRRLQALGRSLDVYVQVNTSGEESKYGLEPDELMGVLSELKNCTALNVRGLMTLAIFTDNRREVRACFSRLRTLRDRARETDPDLLGAELSMGMSGDFEIAIDEGATVVRVGQSIFGRRPTADSEYWPTSP
ncbi:YggS family pyridoxal phosphate-dependent enzyme [Flaviflexus equikiangi]|uniref:YggS family pyridoxal phosphate-dependent enzyme n=1 Tax=Flaviflexus equikiangi TaxID=2758573 RepID=UPI0015F4792B